MPQHVEDSVSCSSADDEIFITSSLRVCKNWRKKTKRKREQEELLLLCDNIKLSLMTLVFNVFK